MCKDIRLKKIMCEVCGCDPCDCDGVNDEFRFVGTDGTVKTSKEYNLVSS